MLRSASNRWAALGLGLALALGAPAPAAAAAPQQEGSPGRVVSSEIELSSGRAELRLELAGGRRHSFSLHDDRAWVDGDRIGDARRGSTLDRAWRALLDRAIEAPAEQLVALLVAWDAPDGPTADRFDRALESRLGAAPAAAGDPAAGDPAAPQEAEEPRAADEAVAPGAAGGTAGVGAGDSLRRLKERIADLERELERSAARTDRVVRRAERDSPWYAPLHYIGHGIANILSILAVYAVLVGLGFAVVFFGHRYLEGIADTARHATVRSGLVGLAGTFLLLPTFLLGIIALTISIVGIPLLLVWVPLFPVAVVLAAIGGYLAIGHAAGEALAERRFYGGEWFRHANSYYYVLTGIGLLLALYIGAAVVGMAGPWLGFIQGLLSFLAAIVTWAAFTIGFGAVLISRGGTRPQAPSPLGTGSGVDDVFQEESHV